MKTKLSTQARSLLALLQRRDLDYTHVDASVYMELRLAGLANVLYSARGNVCFATSRGKAVSL